MRYLRHVATYSAGFPTKHTDLPSAWQTTPRRLALSHFFSQHRSRLNMPDRPEPTSLHALFYHNTRDSARLIDQVSHAGVTSPPFRWRGCSLSGYPHGSRLRIHDATLIVGLAASRVPSSPRVAERRGIHPSYYFHGASRYSLMATSRIKEV